MLVQWEESDPEFQGMIDRLDASNREMEAQFRHDELIQEIQQLKAKDESSPWDWYGKPQLPAPVEARVVEVPTPAQKNEVMMMSGSIVFLGLCIAIFAFVMHLRGGKND